MSIKVTLDAVNRSLGAPSDANAELERLKMLSDSRQDTGHRHLADETTECHPDSNGAKPALRLPQRGKVSGSQEGADGGWDPPL